MTTPQKGLETAPEGGPLARPRLNNGEARETAKIGQRVLSILRSATHSMTGADLTGATHGAAEDAMMIARCIRSTGADSLNGLPDSLQPLIQVIRAYCEQNNATGYAQGDTRYYEMATFISTAGAGFLFRFIEDLPEGGGIDLLDDETYKWLSAMIHALQTCREQIMPDVFEKLKIIYQFTEDPDLKSEILHVFVHRFGGIMQWGETRSMMPSIHVRELPTTSLRAIAELTDLDDFQYNEGDMYLLIEALSTVDDYRAADPSDANEFEHELRKVGEYFNTELQRELAVATTRGNFNNVVPGPDRHNPNAGLHDSRSLDEDGRALRKILFLAQLLDRLYFDTDLITQVVDIASHQEHIDQITGQYVEGKGHPTARNPVEKYGFTCGPTFSYLLVRRYVLHEDTEALSMIEELYRKAPERGKTEISNLFREFSDSETGIFLSKHPGKRQEIVQATHMVVTEYTVIPD